MKKLLILLFFPVLLQAQEIGRFPFPRAVVSVGGNDYEALLEDGNTDFWGVSDGDVDYNGADSIITAWNDELGGSFSLSGGKWYGDSIVLATIGDVMSGSFGADSLAQPVYLYAVLRTSNLTSWASLFYLRDGSNFSVGTNGVPNSYRIRPTDTDIEELSTDWKLIRFTIDGSSSYFQINDDTPTTFTFGSLRVTNFWSIGTENLKYKEIIIRSGAGATAEDEDIATGLLYKYGL